MSANRNLSTDQFFHGSSQEFEPGDLIQPQRVTGAKNWAEQMGFDGDTGPHYTGEHVYHTPTAHEALDFGRHAYQVEPLTPVERDPENNTDTSIGRLTHWTRNAGPARVIRRVT